MKLNSPNIHYRRRRRRQQERGFGLLETMIALSLMSLLFLGTMNLLIASSRATVRTQSQVYAVGDAANSIQTVVGQLREASVFTLPTSNTANTYETGWQPPTGTSLNQFYTTLNGATINTAIQITAPPLLTPVTNGYTANVSNIRVLSSAGANANGYWAISPYYAGGSGTVITLIYRGDPDGTPDSNPAGNATTGAGTYLWQYTMPSDHSFNLIAYPPTALCKSVGTAPDAVQFVRPVSAGAVQANQLEVKIVSSYYSPINGQQTNEEGNGASSSQLVGKCVYMRDHNPTATPNNAVTQQSSNPFQYY